VRLLTALGGRERASSYLPENANLIGSWWQQTWGSKDGTQPLLPTFEAYARQAFGGNAVVFGLMLVRAMLFSEARFAYQNKTSGQLFTSSDLGKLEEPWPGGTTGELLVRMIQDADLAGNAFVRDDGDRMVRLRPDWVSVVANTFGQPDKTFWDVVGYTYRPFGLGDGMEFYPADEIIHWRPVPDPLSPYLGISWLTPVVQEINADIAMTTYKRRFLDNDATPNALIKFQKTLTEDARRRLRDEWHARYGGVEGLHTAVLDSGADFQVIGKDFSAMDFSNVLAAGENRIAVAAGVPGIVAGLKEGLQAATYSNYEQAMRRFADLTMRPLWRSVCGVLESHVAAKGGARLWFDASGIAALSAGEQEQAQTMQVQSAAAYAFITAGYDADSVTEALTAGDLSKLKHTGAVPTALYPAIEQVDAQAAANDKGQASQQQAPHLTFPRVGADPVPHPTGSTPPRPGSQRRFDVSPLGNGHNWVQEVNGLPLYIRAIAHALIRAGHGEQEAVQLAVGAVQNWASGHQHVTPETRAKAGAALAEWEAKKAASHAKGNG
jgi:HK97 family phage portal protein